MDVSVSGNQISHGTEVHNESMFYINCATRQRFALGILFALEISRLKWGCLDIWNYSLNDSVLNDSVLNDSVLND